MFQNQKVIVVMPAYNAEATLVRTYREVMAQPFVDHVIIVDDASGDRTREVAATLPEATYFRHEKNGGYGSNQKDCYRLALEQGADIVVMVHPDYQYTPLLLGAMVTMIGNGLNHCVLGSRILGGHALQGGMPWYKYVANRLLTFIENIFTGAKLSEYHTGYRAFSRKLLETLDLSCNSDDFIFDNQMLCQILWLGAGIGEVSCPTKYFPEASSINFRRSSIYGLGCLWYGLLYRLCRWRLAKSAHFPAAQRDALLSLHQEKPI